ncbi:uncharacterized protein DNG_07293 [Cephalotrichum gorgonifer]|uniref:DUF7580 domain-containing protein n=1 Tax=Cephalotrichum gorgonifer TaxID=2041049 RepID=A0AAE8N372_9PEZI|nr:uncharacterized protein DNG_07293 [Cephalotrichum gorgonifer]
MAEIAGLVLGGIPLIIWALDRYAEPFEAFHHYRTSIETLRTDLVLQNRQLQTTLSNIGLDNEPTIDELRECFATKFPSISRELESIIQRMGTAIYVLMKKLNIDADGKKPDGFAQYEWRKVKHSFSIKKRNKLVADLRHWNDDLRRALEKPEIPLEDNGRKVQDLKKRFNPQRCTSIRQCLSSLHRALKSGFGCACLHPHKAAISLDWNAYQSDLTRSFEVAISYQTNSQPPHESDSWRRLHLTLECPETTKSVPELLTPPVTPARSPSPSSSIRSRISDFRNVRFLSSTPPPLPKSPAASILNLSQSSTAKSISASVEITNLCKTVSTKNGPWLSDFLKDPDQDQDRKFSVDHNQPEPPKITQIIPLKSLLSIHDRQMAQGGKPYLSLSKKQRLCIAASISWSVLHMCGSGWLDEQWSEKQARIFLERGPGGREIPSQYPCASYVFSGPTTQGQTTDDQNYLMSRTAIFALGVLLIELCINKPLEEMRTAGESGPRDPLLVDYPTAESKLDEVYREAGDSYGYATERCVKFAFEGRDIHRDFDFSQFRQQFYDAVVAPVQATYLMFT